MFAVKLLTQPNGIIGKINVRCFSQTLINYQKSNLSQLRKQTGYALSKCKAALDKFEGNIEQATKWLNEEAQKEGWAKADKVKNRATSQGTLVFVNDRQLRRASILELNCETDFVARSEKFLDISAKLALSVIKNAELTGLKQVYYKDELNKLSLVNDPNQTIADQMALAIGSLGENMSVRRAVVMNTDSNQHLSWYMHGSITQSIQQCHFGKFGALVNISMTEPNVNYQPFDIGRQICQHIVGLKPLTLGELPEPSMAKTDGNKIKEPIKFNDDETRLLYQEFLMKSDTRVLDFLVENNTVVNDFVRLECGEHIQNEPGVESI